MEGMIFAVNHPIWHKWLPPCDLGCRCDVVTINLARARRLGLSGSEPTGPWPTVNGEPIQPVGAYTSIATLAATSTGPATSESDLISVVRTTFQAILGTTYGV